LIVTSLFGLLYLWFVIVSYIPAPDGTWVNPAVPYEPSRQAMIVYTLMFLLFFMGYVVVWTNELIGGIIFILWWVAMWFMEILNLAPIEGEAPGDRGGGIAMGFPLFVLGIVFITRWYKGRSGCCPTCGRAFKSHPQQ
jgi:hypothetical protein